MRTSLSRLPVLLAIGCSCLVPPASSAEPPPDPPQAGARKSRKPSALPVKPPDPAFPFGPSGLWFFDKEGWKLGDRSHFAMDLLCDPPQQYQDVEPIGFSIQTMWSHDTAQEKSRRPATAGPGLCYFEGLLWTLRDQFGHSARAVMGRDGSLIGFSVRVWNNSKRHPLVLMREPESPIFHIGLTVGKSNYTNRKKPAPEMVELTLKPREKQEVFVPVREILPEGFDPKDNTECLFAVAVTLSVKDEPGGNMRYVESIYPRVSGLAASLTREGLAMNPKEALEEAEKNRPALFKGK